MLKCTFELEDVIMTAERENEEGNWNVTLKESEQAIKDFGRDKDKRAGLVLNDREMATLLYLATNDEDNGMVTDAMYAIIEPKLKDVPNFLRPIP